MSERNKYYAFISYKRQDEKWAIWLQHRIEHFRLPSSLNGINGNSTGYLRPVFRDASELSAGVLADEIQEALDSSRYLIVICSPNAARSKWVNKEAQHFIECGKVERIIPFIVDGVPNSEQPDNECFPTALLQLPEAKELLGVNINEMGRNAAAIKVIAHMLGVDFDTLWRREEKERKKKNRLLFFILTALLILFASLTFVILNQKKNLQDKNELITSQNDKIRHQYDQIVESRDSVLLLKYEQDMSIARNYLMKQCPEMSLLSVRELEKNLSTVDSETRLKFSELKQAISDSLSVMNYYLVAVDSISVDRTENTEQTVHFGKLFDICPYDDILYEENHYLLVDKTKSPVDSLPFKTFIYSKSGEEAAIQEEVSFSIISKSRGRIAKDIPCEGWFDFMSFPMALSNGGKYLIYREGWRESVDVWWYDTSTKRRNTLKSWHGSAASSAPITHAGFDNTGERYFLTEDGAVVVYAANNHEPIFSLNYERFDSVFWDDVDNICVSVDGSVYRWNSKEKDTYVINSGQTLLNVAVSDNKKLCAAIELYDGNVRLWDVQTGQSVYEGKPLKSPDDLVFANNDCELWITSGYDDLAVLDLRSFKVKHISDVDNKDESDFAPHHWPCFVYVTPDSKYCFTLFTYSSAFRVAQLSNKKRKRINFENSYVPVIDTFAYEQEKGNIYFPMPNNTYGKYDIKKSSFSIVQSSTIPSNVRFIGFPERVDYDPELDDKSSVKLTAYKESKDGTVVAECYTNGTIMVRKVK